MKTGIEALESRTLCANVMVKLVPGTAPYYRFSKANAGTPETNNTIHVSDTFVPGSATLGAQGTLRVTGTPATDAISVKKIGRRIQVVSVTTQPFGPGTTGEVTIRWSFDAAEVKDVVVEGGDGKDVVELDTATQPVTRDSGVETRVVALPDGGYAGDVNVSPLPGVYASDTGKWLARSAAQIATAPRAAADVAVLGDSMMAYFQQTGAASYAKTFGKHSVDLGLPGDTTSQMLYRLEKQGLLDGMSAGAVVLNIGTNNVTLSDNADAIARGVAAVLASIQKRLPDAKVLLLGILPQQRPLQDRVINKVNDRLAALADGTTVRFLSATKAFTGDFAREQYYRRNNLHLTANGYAAWASLIGPALADLIDGR